VGAGEKQNAYIHEQHDQHADEQENVVGEPKQSDQSQRKCKQDHESRDLREGLAAVDVTSAEQAASQVTLVVQSLIPIEEHIMLLSGRSSPGWSPGGIDFERAGTPLIIWRKDNSHS
tara:strand:- start:164 stop:514 length:351 start_codon:yes stop_codon:yes gene_type:complete